MSLVPLWVSSMVTLTFSDQHSAMFFIKSFTYVDLHCHPGQWPLLFPYGPSLQLRNVGLRKGHDLSSMTELDRNDFHLENLT